ncbi:MAG: AAA family ATPase, partial [Victivallales bacterium]|nr:AAA family ATPase [Victivallales bacterium]
MNNKVKTIPYGVSDFINMRRRNGYYVDNTWGIPLMEALPYQLFLRPRRFGKSLLLSILHYYYDVNYADRFDELFGGTWIHENPTEDRGQFLVLHLDFSEISGEKLEDIQQSFEDTCLIALDGFLERYKKQLPKGTQKSVHELHSFSSRLKALVNKIIDTDKRIF